MSGPDQLAAMAVRDVRSGMVVGMGTGRAAGRAIHALAARVKAERLEIRTVSTSRGSEELATALGITVESFSKVDRVDYLFDGADEVDPRLRMIKGGGGAMTREKIVAREAVRRVYLVDESKLVSRLGEKRPLPIEVLEFAVEAVARRLEHLGLRAQTRQEVGRDVRTDNGNLIIDAALPKSAEPEALADALDRISGVVEHGLFLSEADEVLIERIDATIERRER
jgi:ribose 5-phosphate isomerase A